MYESIPGADKSEDENINSFNWMINKLDAYFAPKRHDTLERYSFWSMTPNADEPLDKFLLRAQVISSRCNFGDTEENSREIALVDKIISLAPRDLRKQILEKPNITLTHLTHIINSHYSVQNQSKELGVLGANASASGSSFNLSRGESDISVNRIYSTAKRNSREQPRNSREQPRNIECHRCGSRRHLANDPNCPAQGIRCHECQGIGHFAKKCTSFRNKRKQNFEPDENRSQLPRKRSKINAIEDMAVSEDDDCFVYTISDAHDELIWCDVGGATIEMMIDSGCKYNVVDTNTWKYLKANNARICNVRKSEKQLTAYAQKTQLEVKLQFDAEITVVGEKKRTARATFYVIDGGQRTLLGRDTAKQMGVLMLGLPSQMKIGEEIRLIEGAQPRIFPKVKGVKVHIEIDKTVTPVAQYVRPVPAAFKEPTERKLAQLLEADIIEKVNGTSEWVSPVVIVPKPNGDVRLCVDMRRANQAIIRENHPIPVMDDLLAKLSGAQWFSRLDLADAYHQLELSEESRGITTFITYKGMFRYKRLMFGISCASEKYQKFVEGMLAGIDNVFNVQDDIIIFGDDETHDKALAKVSSRVTNLN